MSRIHRRLNRHSNAFLIVPPSSEEQVVLLTVDTTSKVTVTFDAPTEIRFRDAARGEFITPAGPPRSAAEFDTRVDRSTGGEG